MDYNEEADQAYLDLLIQGYTIIPNILSTDEVDRAKQLFYDWKDTIPDHDRLHRLIDPHGIYKFHEVGHQEHAWFIRTRPRLQNIYKYIYDTQELITSFDGCCYIDKDDNRIDKIWTHTDQAPKDKDFKCYQGFVSLTDNTKRTLVVYEETHDYHEQYFKDKGLNHAKNWNLIDHDTLLKLKDKKSVLDVPAGALVMWDSRIFHQNQFGKESTKDELPNEERIVQYVCFFPKNHEQNTPAIQRKRRKYYEERRTTSHWPCPIHVNGKQPQTYGDDSKIIDYSLLEEPNLEYMKEEIDKLI